MSKCDAITRKILFFSFYSQEIIILIRPITKKNGPMHKQRDITPAARYGSLHRMEAGN